MKYVISMIWLQIAVNGVLNILKLLAAPLLLMFVEVVFTVTEAPIIQQTGITSTLHST